MMSASSHGSTPYYFVPGPSRHPALAAFGLFWVILGAGQWINGADWGKYSLAFGLLFWGSGRPFQKAKMGSMVARLISHSVGA
jgi:hypothetical protein